MQISRIVPPIATVTYCLSRGNFRFKVETEISASECPSDGHAPRGLLCVCVVEDVLCLVSLGHHQLTCGRGREEEVW